jgi:hypothetical protein
MAKIDDTLDKVTIAVTVKDEITSFDEVLLDVSRAKQALYTDMLELMPRPSLRSSGILNSDTINEEYQRGNSDGYNEYYTELLAKLKEYYGISDD